MGGVGAGWPAISYGQPQIARHQESEPQREFPPLLSDCFGIWGTFLVVFSLMQHCSTIILRYRSLSGSSIVSLCWEFKCQGLARGAATRS